MRAAMSTTLAHHGELLLLAVTAFLTAALLLALPAPLVALATAAVSTLPAAATRQAQPPASSVSKAGCGSASCACASTPIPAVTAVLAPAVRRVYHASLGGTGKGHGKRHPTICDRVFIGNNANILGNVTVGENSRVGAGSVVLADVPPNSTVVGVPAHIVYRSGQRVLITDPHDIKDPLSDSLIALAARVEQLEEQLGGQARPADQFTAEAAEREAYRVELERLRQFVSMGEGI